MTSNAATQDIRANVHAMWAAVAEQWREHADTGEERIAAVTQRMFERTALRSGQRVLELACGPGGAGMAAAERVGPEGEVVSTDVADEMVAIAADRARARGLTNLRTATRDIEDIDEPDASYDVVLCREGLMFALEPVRATTEMYRVLRPGGRIAVSVWGPRADNPWLGLVFDAVTAETGFPIPPPGIPGPFSLDDPARLEDAVTRAGFADVAVERVDAPLRSPSFEAWWARTSALAGPLAAILQQLPDAVTAALTQRLRTGAEPYTSDAGVALPGVALVASARRP
jgi:ubiquinone/menaquinone biosynthesis C-methylase UbiE